MQALSVGIESKIIEKIAVFVHDARRGEMGELWKRLQADKITSVPVFMDVLKVISEERYIHAPRLEQEKSRVLAIKLINYLANITQGDDNLSMWIEACKEAFREAQQINCKKKKEEKIEATESLLSCKSNGNGNGNGNGSGNGKSNGNGNGNEKNEEIKRFLVSKYRHAFGRDKIEEDPAGIAFGLIRKIEEPISDALAQSVSMSFIKAISNELEIPISIEQQKDIARRTQNSIKNFLRVVTRIHFTGRKDVAKSCVI